MDKSEVPKMGKRSDVVWLVEPGMREIPRKAIQEARELLAKGKGYVRHVIRAWLERKRVRWRNYEFQPERLGVEVYIDGKYDRSWSNRGIEVAFYKLAVKNPRIIGGVEDAEHKAAKKTDDKDDVDVDMNISIVPKEDV
jgi:hypothetical protein